MVCHSRDNREGIVGIRSGARGGVIFALQCKATQIA